jgi:oxaloacetate decarboxylase gamma subunit
MNSEIQQALLVLFIGMITVFVVLSLVVLTGKLLILLINKYGPVPQKAKIQSRDFVPLLNDSLSKSSNIEKKKLAALVSTVEIVTHGKGTILKIEKGSQN